MSRTFTAKYAGQCCGCGTEIKPGNSVRFVRRGSLFHSGCVPSGPRGRVSRDDQEYYLGRQQAETIKAIRSVYGEEAAMAEEIRQDMNDPNY